MTDIKTGQPFARIEAAEAVSAAAGDDKPAAKPVPSAPQPAEDKKPAEPVPPAPQPGKDKKAVVAEPRAAADDGARKLAPAAPSVRRLARELNVDVNAIDGSGPHARVSKDDVRRMAAGNGAGGARSGGAEPGAQPLPDFSRWGAVRREPMSAIRYATARHVTVCWNAIPRVTHFDQAKISGIEVLRRKYKERAAAAGGNLTMAVMVVKVVATALRKFPKFNTAVDLANRTVIFKDYVNIGIAVATDRGLLVPVIRDADRKNMLELAAEIDVVAKACRDGTVKPAQLEGGTFTVTNLGRIGGSWFTPLVNHPEVAILGLGRATAQPVVRDGKLEIGVILPLSLSYDHRIIDGADAAQFTRWVAEAVEEPLILAMEGKSP